MSFPISVAFKGNDTMSSRLLFSFRGFTQVIVSFSITPSLSCTSPQLAHCFHTPFQDTLVLLHFLQAFIMPPLHFLLRQNYLAEAFHTDSKSHIWISFTRRVMRKLYPSSRRELPIKKDVSLLYICCYKSSYLDL